MLINADYSIEDGAPKQEKKSQVLIQEERREVG